MSAAGANDDGIILPEEPGVAGGDANETNAAENAAPPVPPAAAGGGGGGGGLGDNRMMDLSPYFNTLIDTLHRNNDTTQNAAAAGANNNNNNNAPQLRSMMVSLLWNGAEQIAIAARASFAQQPPPQGGQGAFFAVDTIGGRSDNSFLPPKFAAVYLYAVAQNIVALEEIVLQAGQGVVMDVMDGGISIKQVAEIVSVSVVVELLV